jgi:hypothetical protein
MTGPGLPDPNQLPARLTSWFNKIEEVAQSDASKVGAVVAAARKDLGRFASPVIVTEIDQEISSIVGDVTNQGGSGQAAASGKN